MLEPLAEMASRLRVAVVCNNHFSKGGGNANSRIIGSVAFVNQARAAFIVTEDADDPERLLLMPSKMNIAPIKHGLAYRIEGHAIDANGQDHPDIADRLGVDAGHHHGRPGPRRARREGQDHEGRRHRVPRGRRSPMGRLLPRHDEGRRGAGITTKRSDPRGRRLGSSRGGGFGEGWVWDPPEDALHLEDAHAQGRAFFGPRGHSWESRTRSAGGRTSPADATDHRARTVALLPLTRPIRNSKRPYSGNEITAGPCDSCIEFPVGKTGWHSGCASRARLSSLHNTKRK